MELKKLLRTILSVVMVATLILGSVSMLAGCQPADNVQNPDNDNNHALDYVGLEKEEYLQKLGENNLGDAIDSVGEGYGKLLAGLGNGSAASQSGGAKVNMTITVGDTAMDLLEQLIFGGEAPVDISFLKEISLDMDLGIDGQKQAIQMALGLKGQHIITANLLMNMADSVMHIGLPELNDQWLKIESGENVPNVITGGMSSTAMLAELADALPDAETLTKVLDRYLAIVLDGLKNVDQSTTTLSVGGVSQECTVLALKVYEEDALNIAKSVLNTAKDDTDLKKIIEDFANGVEEMVGEDVGADEAYADFKEGVEDLLADLEEETEFDTESFIQVDTYVDKNHNVIGMKMYSMSEQDSKRGMVYFYNLTEGDKTAFEFAVPSDVNDTDDFKISGTGTKKNGKTSGTYTVSMQGDEMLTVKIADLNEESGTITLTPNMELFGLGEVTDMLGELALEIKLSADGIALNILGDNELLLGIALKALDSDGPSLDAPSNAVDATDSSAMEKWAEKLVMDKLMDNLEKAGAYEFFEMLFEAKADEGPVQTTPNYGYTDEGWG